MSLLKNFINLMPQNFIFNLLNNRILNFFFLIFLAGLIFISHYYFSHIAYFYGDHRWFESLHNISKNKGIFDVLINSTTINGIIWQIINPKINLLSSFNFNLEDDKSYFLYLTLLRIIEITTCFLFISYFVKKKKHHILFFSLLVYFILLQNFSIFDHNSYINFPIILMNFGIALSLFFLEKQFLFFLILFISNTLSFLINPIYFFIACFLPLSFLYLFLLYKKKYINFLIVLISNLPVAALYSFISLATARINLTEMLKPLDQWYNFEIFQSPIFLLLVISFFLIRILDYTKGNKIEFLDIIFILLIFLTIILGFIWEFNLLFWNLPHPIYFDYSLQFIYVTIFVRIFFITKSFLSKFFISLILIFICGYKTINYFKNYLIHESYMADNRNLSYNFEGILAKKFFWEKDSSLYFEKDLNSKTVILDIPNIDTDLFKYVWKNDDNYNLDQKLVLLTSSNFKPFNHSFWHNNFHKSNVRTNLGHSAYMNTSTFLANMDDPGKKYAKESIPKLNINSKILSIYKPDFLISDKKYDLTIKKEYFFNGFKIYLYNLKKAYPSKLITKEAKNLNEFHENIKYFDKNLYIFDKDFIKKKEIKVCNFETKFENNVSLKFIVKNNEKKECILILPLTFSNNNLIINEINKQEMKTFRVQYHFHGIIINDSLNLEIKKRKLINFAFYSMKDYLEFNKLTK
jgi:hypothetical protein